MHKLLTGKKAKKKPRKQGMPPPKTKKIPQSRTMLHVKLLFFQLSGSVYKFQPGFGDTNFGTGKYN